MKPFNPLRPGYGCSSEEYLKKHGTKLKKMPKKWNMIPGDKFLVCYFKYEKNKYYDVVYRKEHFDDYKNNDKILENWYFPKNALCLFK